ncbi:MAG: cytochrome c [Meiothermus sp.]|uniref:c-type cytochrome n=1 Tax=Meiothermus sp. TaxID=1955249 RepID=UPI0025DCCF7A|nr:cytochrome c [Meiothermus sp.]MCS7057733.1 cytochrome c [Meiothermus sp.]MCS7194460.1 cytochrome c [Meiothermus sp.]MCX7740040.1 cytochrome c [Meiothermus sp.]MDW8091912.1 cytochrome c [Meiothermus sp.]MDW8482337.1 cytochrome c [Meiothermus sp.]
MPIERIEVYLDNGSEPVQVLREPPFKLTYDTRNLADGEHLLRVVTHYTNGAKEVKEIPFKVANTPGVLVQGLEEGKEVSGTLEVTLRVADPEVRPTRERFPGLGAAIATAAILGGVWLFFAATNVTQKTLEEVAKPPAAAEAHGGGHGGEHAAAPVDAALKAKGEQVYTANCAGCHQATGQGLPGVFPALAGSKHVADKAYTINILLKGKGGMPSFAQLSDEELAAVATYIKNSWGNSFGGVTPDEFKAAR